MFVRGCALDAALDGHVGDAGGVLDLAERGSAGGGEGGATGTLDYRGGALTFTGTNTALNSGSGGLTVGRGWRPARA